MNRVTSGDDMMPREGRRRFRGACAWGSGKRRSKRARYRIIDSHDVAATVALPVGACAARRRPAVRDCQGLWSGVRDQGPAPGKAEAGASPWSLVHHSTVQWPAKNPRTQHSRVGMLRQNNQHTPARAAVLAAVLRHMPA